MYYFPRGPSYSTLEQELLHSSIKTYKDCIQRAPLLFCLNYSRTEWVGGLLEKNTTPIPVNPVLEIPVLSINAGHAPTRKMVKYECCGVIFHKGSLANSGHYISCVKMGPE